MLINEKNPHGGQIYNKKIRADFSVNVNPKGTPSSVIEEAYKGILESMQYPDASCGLLREAIARKENVKVEHIICGNGGAELIFQVTAAAKPRKALLIEPTFCEYRQSVNACGCTTETYYLRESSNFDVNLEIDSILERITEDIDLVFLCNPNNPTGLVTMKKNVIRILDKCKKTETILVLDESFGDLTEDYESFSLTDEVEKNDNLFILKSMTKTYAMAGIRLGYGLCSNEELLDKMCFITQCWNVSIVAQRAGIAALKCEEYVEETLKILSKERKYITDELTAIGIKVFPGKANYLLIWADKKLYEFMLANGILIRACSNFNGLNQNYFRIAVKDHQQNELLIGAFKEIYK